MATAIAVPHLAPRPSPVSVASWNLPKPCMPGKENRSSSKQDSNSPSKPKKERPCDGCRRRKSKCVLQESRRCVLCEFHKQECTFVEKALPRKRKSVPDGNENTSPRKSPTMTHATAPQSRRESPTPRSTQLPTMPTTGPFVVDESLSLQRDRHCKLLGRTTALDACLINLGAFSDANETQSRFGVLRQVAQNEYFTTHADADLPLPEEEARALADIEDIVGHRGKDLIDVYFNNVHPSYPILQKTAFMDRHLNGDRHFNPALIAAMYILAIGWWDHEPKLSAHPKPDVGRLEMIALRSLMMSMQRPKISGVQAGLLLLQRSKTSTWTLTVQIVALGQDIGLHLDCSEWSIPLWERRLRRRLAWALYMQDKWSSLMHGRPSHIQPVDWVVPLPTLEDFDESVSPLPTPTEESPNSETSRGRLIFLQMISLTNIMAEVCDTFYSQAAHNEALQAGPNATQLILNRAKPVQLRLKAWYSSLPPECKMDYTSNPDDPSTPSSSSSPPPPTLSSTGYLHLGYFATEISIHRRIISSLSLSVSSPPSSNSSTSSTSTSPSTSPSPYMLYIIRSAAKTRLISAMDFVNRLRPEHLHAFWYFASTANFALIGTFGALLQASAPGLEEAEFYAARLNEYRWTLSMCARQAPWISGALDLLRANDELLGELRKRREDDVEME